MVQVHHDTGAIEAICESHGRRRDRLMDIVVDVHRRYGRVDDALMDEIATELGVPRVDVESIVSFYSFLDKRPRGQFIIRLCNDLIDRQSGIDGIAVELQRLLGIEMGETTRDGLFTLEWTPFIGMGDQAPAAMVNEVIVTRLKTADLPGMIEELREHRDPRRLVKECGDGNNAHPLIRSMVRNSIRRRDEVLFGKFSDGVGLVNALHLSPDDVIDVIKRSGLQGRGGAGFSTGQKWECTRAAPGTHRWVICNADEGEPGTFKDRVLLTERAEMMIEGMTIAGYALGTSQGLIYLRAEYAYLRQYLQDVIDERRRRGLLGKGLLGHDDFGFEVTIRMGAGAYICGEETSLISSVEGQRGDPKLRPPFPAQKGYLASPTAVNNVETLCCVPRILEEGPAWFAAIGTDRSKGTKAFSVSGDCTRPGVFELPYGSTLRELLDMAGAEDIHAVQIGGPSGQMVGADALDRKLAFEDLNGGGSIMVFNSTRDVIDIARQFTKFFADESCGHCTPCRVGNELMEDRLDQILKGRGRLQDLDYIESLGRTMKNSSRCGLGQTAANPAVTSLNAFREEWEAAVDRSDGLLLPRFSLADALAPAEAIAGRVSVNSHVIREVQS